MEYILGHHAGFSTRHGGQISCQTMYVNSQDRRVRYIQSLSQQSGYTRGYLSKVSTGKLPLTRTFIEMVSFKLNEPIESLFRLDTAALTSGDNPSDHETRT